jgi:hypothetical protein
MLFKSFAEAYTMVNVKSDPDIIISGNNQKGIIALQIIDNNRSYNVISQGGRVVKYVGYGILSSPGHPNSNQQWHSQEPFNISLEKAMLIPIFRKDIYSNIQFMGYYRIKNIIKKMSLEGFSFFQVILFRVHFSHQLVSWT